MILDVARQEISEHGIDGVSIRSIARRVGVDPKLVRHYYGSREQLLREAVQVDMDPGSLPSGCCTAAGGGSAGTSPPSCWSTGTARARWSRTVPACPRR
ncbi:TetR/AcrR family transcriptional regulator [Phytohabitans rumicis]|uniref:HTH tetR-type domain-containing protein n=1 Tax=Phytohabitans rumicis TaxID=1076125 RepID=A0A6V8L7W4_9ACTN|nr:helix-turn-helix domain-containing protein [Phytohabitans rumicis]GFJ91630.1 hypothetical protein Prum_052720 [Phytohabitans rumicis]